MTTQQTTAIALNIQSWHKILIVGGGHIAMAKSLYFKDYMENITVIAEDLSFEFEELIVKEKITYIQGNYKTYFHDKSELLKWFIIVVACDDHELNKYIHDQVYGTNTLLNIVDNSTLSTFHLPAVVKRNNLQLSISTHGKSPAFARWIKSKMEQILNDLPYDNLLEFMGKKREYVKSQLEDSQRRRLFWYEFMEQTSLAKNIKIDDLFKECLEGFIQDNPTEKARLYLVGVGSGDPENLTLKAIKAISKADVILYDRLIPKNILHYYARSEAIKIYVGKKRGNKIIQQEMINDLIRLHVGNNKIVTRVKGGDTSIFSRVADEINVARETQTDYELIPGIGAMSGCAAQAGFPLTIKGISSSLKVMTIYKDDITNDDKWQYVDPHETIVFYMSIRYLNHMVMKLMAYGFAPSTPIAIIENGTNPDHKEYYSTLENIENHYADYTFKNPSLVIVGNVLKLAKLWL